MSTKQRMNRIPGRGRTMRLTIGQVRWSHSPRTVASLFHCDRGWQPVSIGRRVAGCYLFGTGRSTCHVDDQDDASRKGPVNVQEIGWCSCGAPCGQALPRRSLLRVQKWLNVGDRWCPTERRDQWERQPLCSARIDAKIFPRYGAGISCGMRLVTCCLLLWGSRFRMRITVQTGPGQDKHGV